jgi:hypothetical protein
LGWESGWALRPNNATHMGSTMKKIRRDEKRDCVRARLHADVHCAVMDECEVIKEDQDDRLDRFVVQPIKRSAPVEEDRYSPGGGFDPNLVDFLIQIEDKLDRVLKLLGGHEKHDENVFVGQGVDIGGGGMRMLCDAAVKPGQILKISFRIFRYPIVSLQVFGKVVRLNPLQKEGKQGYEVAVEFLNLHEDYKEWIITYVFQMQRESIRSKRTAKNA